MPRRLTEAAPGAEPCLKWALAEPLESRCTVEPDWKPTVIGDWPCVGSKSSLNCGTTIPSIVVGGEAELAALLGRAPSAEALRILNDGGMVIMNKIYLHADGRNDHASLARVGADTRRGKAMSGSQTVMTAMLGTVTGLFAGAVPAIGVLSLLRGLSPSCVTAKTR